MDILRVRIDLVSRASRAHETFLGLPTRRLPNPCVTNQSLWFFSPRAAPTVGAVVPEECQLRNVWNTFGDLLLSFRNDMFLC